MAGKIKPKQIDFLLGQATWSTNLQLSAAASQSVTSFFSGKISGGSDTSAGVITSTPSNKIYLRIAGTGHPVTDQATGESVFARLTEISGAWTLGYFILQNGTEVSYNTTGNPAVGQAINFRWCEIVQAANYKPTMVVNVGEGIDEFDATSASSHQHIIDPITITTNGQTAITLSQTPKDGNDIELIINTVSYYASKHFNVSGATITWTNTAASGGFDLETIDDVAAMYAYAG